MSNLEGSQSNINPEILHLLKSGQVPFPLLQDYLKELRQPEYPMDFVKFMDQMIEEKELDRKTVIARSGLSESLAYKYLNGNKRTTERDYILAFCIALHMNFPQTQHALRCCGLPLLGAQDLRAIIIRMGIEEGMDRHQIDECLEKQGFPMIRISSDMPSAVITDSMYSESGNPILAEDNSNSNHSMTGNPRDDYEIIDSAAKAIHNGNAPFDYDYIGEMAVKNEAGDIFHLEAAYLVTGDTFFTVMNEEQYKAYKEMMDDAESPEELSEEDQKEIDDMIRSFQEGNWTSEAQDVIIEEPDKESGCLEEYDSLIAATASEFFPFFMELDHLTDKKVAEVMSQVDDSRNYPYRVGAHLSGNGPEIYIEMFNRTQPELREYYQMIETADHHCTYTASHESYFMQIELNNIYEAYFQKKREPEYFLKATEADFNQLDKRYRMIFNNLRHCLHTFARSTETLVHIPDDQFYREEAEFFAEVFVISMRSGDTEQARQALQEEESAVKSGHFTDAEELIYMTIIDLRRYNMAESDGKPEEAEKYRKAIIARKKKALKYEKELGDDASTVFTTIADVLLDKWRHDQKEGTNENPKKKLEEILDLMNHGAFSDEKANSRERFEVYQSYAFHMDSTNPELAEEYYLKAIKEATKHHLDMDKYAAAAVAGTYNNYAWMLWNVQGNEEAIMYYGRAIELTETYLENDMLPPKRAKENLAHYGAALLGIYDATSKQKEKERLLKRLQKSCGAPEKQQTKNEAKKTKG